MCEKVFGNALKLQPELRMQMQIISKCGIVCPSEETGNTVKHYDLSYDYIMKRVEESLEALGIDWLDVLLIHRPSPLMNAKEVARAFEDLHAKNKVKYFGVSNFTPSQFRLLQSKLKMKLVTNQIELHPLNMSSFYDGTLDQAQELDFSPMIWSPLAQGRLMKETLHDEALMRVQTKMKQIAKSHQATVDQVIH